MPPINSIQFGNARRRFSNFICAIAFFYVRKSLNGVYALAITFNIMFLSYRQPGDVAISNAPLFCIRRNEMSLLKVTSFRVGGLGGETSSHLAKLLFSKRKRKVYASYS